MDKTIYMAKDAEGLDRIVLDFYGTLTVFEEVLSLNPELDPVLKGGELITLPKLETVSDAPVEESKALW